MFDNNRRLRHMAWEYMGERYGTDFDLAYAMVRGGYVEDSFKAWVNDNCTAYEVLSGVRHVIKRCRDEGSGIRGLVRTLEMEYATVIAENIEADVDEYEDDCGGVAVRIPCTEDDE